MTDDNFKLALKLAPVLLIALLVIYFIGRSSGKGKALKEKNTPPKVVYPNNGQDIPVNWDANILADEMYNQMNGVTWNKIKLEGYFAAYVGLQTDEMFIAVYDVFNQKHMKSDTGTLRQWITDEDYNFPIAGQPHVFRDAVLQRMDLLTLK